MITGRAGRNLMPSHPLLKSQVATHLRSSRSPGPIYMGETTSLRHRMSDLGRMVNHTFRRWVAAQLNVDGREGRESIGHDVQEIRTVIH
ncbi:MAG: hypothetical protein JWO52_6884 [Gammaproteobacteria bacterium]|nr:hypothetical protein [Gammaproteobacteria bacterium]